MRIKILRVLIAVVFFIIACALFYHQAIRGPYFYNLSVNNRIRVVPLESFRGRIYDRHGNILADNRIVYNVLVIPQEINDKDEEQELFSFLSDTLEMERERIRNRYYQKKFTPFTPVVIAEDIRRPAALILEENKFRFPSLIVQKSYQREYPGGVASSHIVGYVGKTNRSELQRIKDYGLSRQNIIGKSGIEQYYDSFLKGEDGGIQVEINSRGQQVQLLGLKRPQQGQDIRLTIDQEIQETAADLLGDKPGTIVVMDLSHGDILGMVSSPAFDPNIFVDRKKQNRTTKVFGDPRSPLLNRATKGLFPAGSVFKVPVSVCALDSGKATPHTTFVCPGYYELGGIRFGCTHAHGSQNLIEAIAHSCNVYFYNLGIILGVDSIHRYAKVLGLGKPTHIDLSDEKTGLIPDGHYKLMRKGKRWYAGDTLNMSIGQGDVLTTPLQLTRMMATVANEGREIQPHLIHTIGAAEVDKYDFDRLINIPEAVFADVKRGLRATVTDYAGTAHVLNLKEVYVAGKTGTAQSGKDKEHHAWFVGYAKGQKRNIAFCVFLEHGGSSQNANLIARQLLLELVQERIL